MSFGATTILAIVTIFQQGSVFISTQIPNTPSKFLSTNPYNFHSSSHVISYAITSLLFFIWTMESGTLQPCPLFFSLDLIFRRIFSSKFMPRVPLFGCADSFFLYRICSIKVRCNTIFLKIYRVFLQNLTAKLHLFFSIQVSNKSLLLTMLSPYPCLFITLLKVSAWPKHTSIRN